MSLPIFTLFILIRLVFLSIFLVDVFQVFVGLEEDEKKHLLHLSTDHQLDVVRWNLANQDEVGFTSI